MDVRERAGIVSLQWAYLTAVRAVAGFPTSWGSIETAHLRLLREPGEPYAKMAAELAAFAEKYNRTLPIWD